MADEGPWYGGGKGNFSDFAKLEKKFHGWKNSINRSRKKITIALILIAAAIYLLSGIYTVNPGEVGVVRQFGKEIGQTQPGLRYHLPYPIQKVNIVNMAKIRKAEIGFRTIERKGKPSYHERHLEESLMLTGDENIADIQVLVQYRVKDASNFLFKVKNPEIALRKATEVALRGVIGKTTIDEAMTTGRSTVEAETLKFLQKLLDNYSTGLHVVELKLLVVDPPDEVKDAFHEVVRALEDKDRLIREAEGYKEDIVPKARGEAQKRITEAEAYKQKRIMEAEGDVKKFQQLLAEYQKAKSITRQRIYLEYLERILDEVDKIIVNPKIAGGTMQKILPLKKLVTIETGK